MVGVDGCQVAKNIRTDIHNKLKDTSLAAVKQVCLSNINAFLVDLQAFAPLYLDAKVPPSNFQHVRPECCSKQIDF